MRIPKRPPDPQRIMNDLLGEDQNKAFELLTNPPTDTYLHWDELRHRPTPDGLNHEQWWAALRLGRDRLRRELSLQDERGGPFIFTTPDAVLEACHKIDKQASGQIAMPEAITNSDLRDRYIVNSLMEEAATSSILEGASTTVKKAKEMLRSGASPGTKDERMVINNFRALNFVREEMTAPLTLDHLLELHRIVTEGTLESTDQEGRLRFSSEDVRVQDRVTGEVLHIPPAAEGLDARAEALCRFANGDTPDYFLHPVLRAILLHFWLSYDHPFVDGNGRTARALFFWSMFNQGYWLFEFVSISRIVYEGPAKYARAFLYSETDSNDCTYFILYHLNIIARALEALRRYLERKMQEIRAAEQLLRNASSLNHRQLALVSHALRHPDAAYTIASHKNSHRVVYQTARTDLLDLCEKDILSRVKIGREHYFVPHRDLRTRLQRIR